LRRLVVAYVIVFTVPFVISLMVTPWVARVAWRWHWVDVPGGRRRHHRVVPRLGGVAPVLGFLVGVGLPVLFPAHFPPVTDPNQPVWWRGLVVGTFIALVGGIWDDVRDLSPRQQFAVQGLCAGAAIWGTLFIERVNNPLTGAQIIFPRGVVWGLTLFWVAGMMNTVNWLDGVDGLVATVTAVFSVVMVLHLVSRHLYSVALWPLALLGAVLGFLPYNWPPARVFLGSAGSYGLGFIMAALGIAAGAKVATVLLVLGLPIADVAWQIVRRWRLGRSPFVGDRGHFHHRLYDLGWSPQRIVLLYAGWAAVMGGISLVLSSRLLKLLVLFIVALAVTALFIWASRQSTGEG